MAGNVYSARFFGGTVGSSSTTMFTVPAGYVYVVRYMSLGYATTARAGGVVTVLLNPGSGRVWVVPVQASTVSSTSWSGHLVLNAGESLSCSTTATGPIYLTSSGYRLTSP